MKPAYLVLACGLMVAQWSLNAIRFRILVNSLDNSVTFLASLRAFMANVFLSAVTPSQTGGGPVQIYILNRAGVPLAKGFAGCLMGAVLTVVCLLVSTAVILASSAGLRTEFGRHLTGVIMTVVLVFSALAGLFVLSIVRIEAMKRLTGRTLLVLMRMLKTERRLAITKRVLGGLDQYRECVSIFASRRKARVLAALAFTMAGVATNALIAPVVLASLSVSFDVTKVYLAQFILLFIGYFSPTPGASGIAEFSSYWVLSALDVAPEALGLYTVLWRFFTGYAGVVVGGAIVLGLLRRGSPRDEGRQQPTAREGRCRSRAPGGRCR
jgi:uncharacterized protein (TIRG00374 family)